MTRVVLLAVVALVLVCQVSGEPNHYGLLKEAKRNVFGRRGFQLTNGGGAVEYCDALEQKREVFCQHNHGTDAPKDSATAGAIRSQDEFVKRREASKFLGRGAFQDLLEECCHEGCHAEEIHEHCPKVY